MVTPLLVFISAYNYYDFVGSLKSVFLTARLLFPPYNYSLCRQVIFFLSLIFCLVSVFFFFSKSACTLSLRCSSRGKGQCHVRLVSAVTHTGEEICLKCDEHDVEDWACAGRAFVCSVSVVVDYTTGRRNYIVFSTTWRKTKSYCAT